MSETERERARQWLDMQDISDRSADKTWYGISVDKLAWLMADYLAARLKEKNNG